ncbi:MAG: efflux RND transporter periplasmic adaptor subunit, partial [Desulfotignum sp.]
MLLPVLGFMACGQGDVQDTPGRQQPPPRVTVFQIQKTDMDVFRNYPAKIHGSKQVQVRARVQGILKEKRYLEGGFVSENDILFIIDPQPYQIALRKAEAALADARASFDHTKREWERHARLFEKNAVSQRERDQALTNFELARAHLSLSEAALDDDQRNLSYTQVRSPIAGVTGMEDVS